MFTTFLVLGFLWVISAVFVALLARRAPFGFENETGFHVVETSREDGAMLVPALRTG